MVHTLCTIIFIALSLPLIRFIYMELTKKQNGPQIDFEDIDLLNKDPMALWENWFKEAKTVPENKLPIGMSMATVQPNGQPAARTLLMRGYDTRGFQIYTDYTSPKALELLHENSAALVFLWCFVPPNGTKPDGVRQVRVKGITEKLSRKESEAYFERESIDSKIRAVVQQQSQRMTSKRRQEMLEQARFLYKQFENDPSYRVEMPEKWGGYVIRPTVFEFFQATSNALATRVRFRKRNESELNLTVFPDGVEAGAGDWVYEYLEF